MRATTPDDAFAALRRDVHTTLAYEASLRGRPEYAADARDAAPAAQVNSDAKRGLDAALDAALGARKRARAEAPAADDLSDAALSQYARFTKEIALAPYTPFLHYVPRLVNVVHRAPAPVAPWLTARRPRRAAPRLLTRGPLVCR